MTYEQFKKASDKLQDFIQEHKKLDSVIKVISPTSTGVVEFGLDFIDDYIDVVEIALGDKYGNFSWFVFENNFGRQKLEVRINNIDYRITNTKSFYNILIKHGI